MVTHQGCPQTPGGRIRALGFVRMGARGRRRGPIPAVCHRYSSPVSLTGLLDFAPTSGLRFCPRRRINRGSRFPRL